MYLHIHNITLSTEREGCICMSRTEGGGITSFIGISSAEGEVCELLNNSSIFQIETIPQIFIFCFLEPE